LATKNALSARRVRGGCSSSPRQISGKFTLPSEHALVKN
jgi:hypothetical protein